VAASALGELASWSGWGLSAVGRVGGGFCWARDPPSSFSSMSPAPCSSAWVALVFALSLGDSPVREPCCASTVLLNERFLSAAGGGAVFGWVRATFTCVSEVSLTSGE